jgi:type IV secretory pathway VirJ component
MLIPLLVTLLACAHPAPGATASPASAARATDPDTGTNVRDLPILELRASHVTSPTLAIILSGDGGWADIDQRVGQRLQARGVDVIGVDMRDYLRGGRRTPAGIGADISRIARRYMGLWQRPSFALVGYSRGSDLAPFAAAHLAGDIRPRLELIAFLSLLERASFTYHFSDLWRTTSGNGDIPILPVLEQLRGTPMLCIYGKDEKESLCRTAPAGLMRVVERPGAHHFDGNYDVLADEVYTAMQKAAAR